MSKMSYAERVELAGDECRENAGWTWRRASIAETTMNPIQLALHEQLRTLALIKHLQEAVWDHEMQSSWRWDEHILTNATPFTWSSTAMRAVMRASESIPLDTQLEAWNFPTQYCFWRFEEPLPVQTLLDPDRHVRALSFAWLKTRKEQPGTWDKPGKPAWYGIPVAVWCDGDEKFKERYDYPLSPSQTWDWEQGTTLGGMLADVAKWHNQRYGPGGELEHVTKLGHEKFMIATEKLSRFMLAASVWLNQRVITSEPGHIERHERKRIAKQIGREPQVRVVQLRRQETRHETSESAATETHWNCQWVVDGHWRNQAFGSHMSQRRLTWIDPYLKGPEDKPLKQSGAKKVFQVNR